MHAALISPLPLLRTARCLLRHPGNMCVGHRCRRRTGWGERSARPRRRACGARPRPSARPARSAPRFRLAAPRRPSRPPADAWRPACAVTRRVAAVAAAAARTRSCGPATAEPRARRRAGARAHPALARRRGPRPRRRPRCVPGDLSRPRMVLRGGWRRAAGLGSRMRRLARQRPA